jgi:hypothetical protein
LLYWYKSTSTDAEVAAAANLTEAAGMLGGADGMLGSGKVEAAKKVAQFSCFTSTKVQILRAAAKSRPPRRLSHCPKPQ